MRPALIILAVLLSACGRETPPAGDMATTQDMNPVPVGRLPGTVHPVAYRLDLTVLPELDEFTGRAEIDVRLDTPADFIYLHGNQLDVASAAVTDARGTLHQARYEQVHPSGVVRLTPDAPLPAGPATLSFEYSAAFRESAEGLYHTQVAGLAYAFTQFQPIDARRVFPGFDEPAFKTPFDISVITHEDHITISNAPVLAEEPAGEQLKRTRFATTAPLPTYLVALVVGPLDIAGGAPLPPNETRERPLPFRAVATRGNGDRLRFVVENTEPIMRYLENYFGVEYPYAKLDLIASPEFGTGAMENAGAIIYGDALLLVDDGAAPEQLQRLGATHAHELAHHWFGDLVTPKWWDDTWLNESFASWMGNKAANAWRPQYQLDTVSLVQALAAMDLDSRIAARQIRQPVDSSMQIASSFDAITYLKGGGVLSMFESYLGNEGFRAGLRLHLRRFANSVADVEDFMASLAEGSGRPDVVPAFRSFIDQPGVPLADISVACEIPGEPATMTVRQSRYLPVGSRGDATQTWRLPLCVRSGGEGEAVKQCTLLTAAETTLAVAASGCPAFVMPNADGAGYYRFALGEAGWDALMANFDQLNRREALAAADSLSADWQADRLSTAALIDGIAVLAASPYPLVATAPGSDLVRLAEQIASPESRDAVLSLARSLYRPRLAEVERKSATGDADAQVERALFRTRLVRLLALDAEDLELRAELAAPAARFLRMDAGEHAGLDRAALEPALVPVALAAGVQVLGAPFVDTLIDRMFASDDARFRTDAAIALGSSDDPAIGDRARDLLLDDRLRGREPTSLLFALADRPSQRRATFDWFRANEAQFTAKISHFAHRLLPRVGEGFCTTEARNAVDAFFAPRIGKWQGAGHTLAEVLEGIELCAALRDVKRAEVDAYFAGT